jgi:hypothetical protein
MLAALDSSLLIAAAASFVAGLVGYIIVRMWIKPIVGYMLVKRKFDRELRSYSMQFDPDGEQNNSSARSFLKKARAHAMNLDTRYNSDIPAWYRLLLVSRGESPVAALQALGPLSKIKDGKQIEVRISRARKALRLSAT